MTEDTKGKKPSTRRRMGIKNRLAYMGILPERLADVELGYSEMREIKKRFFRHRVGVVSTSVILIVIFIAVFADVLAPYDPLYGTDYDNIYLPPVGMSWSYIGETLHGTWEHPLGTDNLGRDIISRLMKGAQSSLLVGGLSVTIALSIGIVLGLVAGYFMGAVDRIIMRMLDVVYAFPAIMLAAVLVAYTGPSLTNLIIVMGIVFVPGFTRIVRGSVLSEKERDYVLSARSIGLNRSRIIFRHIFPNVLAPIIVIGTLRLAAAIIVESSLSFLGLGPPAPIPTWGSMLASGRDFLQLYPTLCIFPGLAILITVLGFNLAGDGMRDALDPALREG